MKYQIGDKVRVRQDLEPCTIYGDVMFMSDMASFPVVTISSMSNFLNISRYSVEENLFEYTDEMLDGKVEDTIIKNNKCTCSIQDLMLQGCKCGGK